MSVLARILDKNVIRTLPKAASSFYSTKPDAVEDEMEFRVLNLRPSKMQHNLPRRKFKKADVLPPRTNQMAVDQAWGNVWPGPRTFHPATVPLPIRQGYGEKHAPPDKYGNAELMKIPNFLHLTPPVIKQQCEAIKKFCTPWPKALPNDEACEKHFPIEVTTSNYCHSSPTIRDHMARIVTVRFKLSSMNFDKHAKDKFLRLITDKYNEKTDYVTIVTDRCPMRKQNYDYAMYLITALYHESWNVEPWEALKSEADMEYYDWDKSRSKQSIEVMFQKSVADIPNVEEYSKSVDQYMNEGESEYTITKYAEAVRKLLQVPLKIGE